MLKYCMLRLVLGITTGINDIIMLKIQSDSSVLHVTCGSLVVWVASFAKFH